MAFGLARGLQTAREFLTGALDRLDAWREHARQIRDLRGMTERELKDIGLSRADVEREAAKPFWRAKSG